MNPLYRVACRRCGWVGHRTIPGGETKKCPECGQVTLSSTALDEGTDVNVKTPAGVNVAWHWGIGGWVPA